MNIYRELAEVIPQYDIEPDPFPGIKCRKCTRIFARPTTDFTGLCGACDFKELYKKIMRHK